MRIAGTKYFPIRASTPASIVCQFGGFSLATFTRHAALNFGRFCRLFLASFGFFSDIKKVQYRTSTLVQYLEALRPTFNEIKNPRTSTSCRNMDVRKVMIMHMADCNYLNNMMKCADFC